MEDSNHDDLSYDDGDDNGWDDDDDGVSFESQDMNSEAIGTAPPDTSIGMASGHINNGPDGSNGNDSGSDINASHIQNDHPRQHKRNSIEIHLHPTTPSEEEELILKAAQMQQGVKPDEHDLQEVSTDSELVTISPEKEPPRDDDIVVEHDLDSDPFEDRHCVHECFRIWNRTAHVHVQYNCSISSHLL